MPVASVRTVIAFRATAGDHHGRVGNACVGYGVNHLAGNRALGLAAGGELERADAGLPVVAVGGVVLLGVPEGAVVGRIHAHRAVVAPAVGAGLRAGAVDQHPFGLRHLAGDLTVEAAGIADAGIDAAVGDAVSDRGVAVAVGGDGGHPTIDAVAGVEAALLEQGRRAAGIAHFVPTRHGQAALVHGVGGPQRLMGAHVAVLELHHQAEAERVQPLGRAWLWDGAGVPVERGNRHADGTGEGGVGRSGEVGVEAIEVQAVRRGHLGEVVGRAGRRRRAAQVAGQEAAAGAVETQVEVHFLQRAAGQQRGLVDAPQAHAEAGAHDLEHVGRHVVAIRPYAQFGIVAKEVAGENTGVDLHGVEVPATGHRVAGLGDCDTLVVRAGVLIEPGEVRDDPAVDQRVVEHHRVAVVAGVARAAGRAGEKGVEGYRRDGSAGGLVVDADRRVDGLDVMVGADVAVGIGRPARAVRAELHAGEVGAGRRGRLLCTSCWSRQMGRPLGCLGVEGLHLHRGQACRHDVRRIAARCIRRGDRRQSAQVAVPDSRIDRFACERSQDAGRIRRWLQRSLSWGSAYGGAHAGEQRQYREQVKDTSCAHHGLLCES